MYAVRREMQHHNRTIKYVKYILSFFLVLGALFAAGQHRLTAYAEGSDRIYYFNMSANGNEGNMILVETSGHWGLMDAGHRYAKTITDSTGAIYSTAVNGLSSQISCRNGRDVANYMINILGVKHLDFVIGTHAHSDHIGGIPELVAATYTDASGQTCHLVDGSTTYYYKEYEHISDLEDDVARYSSNSWHNQAFAYQAVEAMREQGVTNLINVADGRVITEAEQADYGRYIEFTVGDSGITFRLYNLDEQTFSGNENINSIVTVVSNGDYTVVNLADINTNNGAIDKVAAAIAQDYGKIDVVVAGHHGYAGSNTKTMFDELQPGIVVVSNGMGDSYLYTDGDLGAAIPYAQGLWGTLFYNTSISYYGTVTTLSGDSVKIYSLEGDGRLTEAAERMMKASNKTGWAAWVNTDGTLWSYLRNGKSVKDDWVQDGGKWYFLDSTGIMATAAWVDDGHYVWPDGVMATGWVKLDENWYYMDPNRSSKTYGKIVTNWQTINKKMYFFDENGVMASNAWINGHYVWPDGEMATGWVKLDNKWYYMDSNKSSKTYGKTMTGWQTISGKRYYFDENGIMASNAWIDGHYLWGDGVMATGKSKIGDKWYYLDGNGNIKTGWQRINSAQYYLNEDGQIVTSEWVDGHYLWGDGVMATGWAQIEGHWYYLNSNGEKQTGWQTISGKRYYFDENGIMASNAWIDGHYLWGDGVMATGWAQIEGKWYFFYKDGSMATDTVIDGYYIDSNGIWIESA